MALSTHDRQDPTRSGRLLIDHGAPAGLPIADVTLECGNEMLLWNISVSDSEHPVAENRRAWQIIDLQ